MNGTINGSNLFSQIFFCAGQLSGPSANILSTQGTTFTAAKGGTGIYNVTFGSTHPKTTLVVHVSCGTSNAYFAVVSNITSSGVTIKVFNTAAAAVDSQVIFSVFL